MAVETATFAGFRPEAIQFLPDLAVNNDRAWFQPPKAEYERLLKRPPQELCLAVDRDPARIHAAIDAPAFVSTFGRLSHEEYALKRVPQGYAADHPEANLLKLKDIVFGKRLADADAFSPNLPDLLAETLGAAVPVFRLLAELEA